MRKFYDYLCKTEVVVAATCFAVSCLLIFMAAVARTMDRPINWSQDLSLFLFAWSVFLSADAALRADKLVNVDLLMHRLPPTLRKVVSLGNHALILAFLSAMVYFGIKLAYISRVRVFQGIPGFSYTWVTLSVPVGSFLMIITTVLKMRALLVHRKEA